MLEKYATVLEVSNIDWCYNCASSFLERKGDKKNAFAYIFIQYARLANDRIKKHIHYDIKEYEITIKMDNDIFIEWDLPFFKSKKRKASYYEFLTPLFEEHILTFAKITTSKYRFSFDKENNLYIKCGVNQ